MSLHNHLEDEIYCRILNSLLLKTLQHYLLIQSSQWHTLKSKQFSYYEQTQSESFREKEDGIETLLYLLQYLLQQLPGITISLSGSSVEECPLAYFCSMISDRLRAEPYLFNPYLNLLAAIANTSQSSADAVYQFIEKAPSEHISWTLMLNSLNEGEQLMQTDTAQRGLLDPDVTGFIAILGLLSSVLRHASDCSSIRSNLQVNTVTLCIRLLHQPVHIVLKARICSLLECVVSDPHYAQLLLQQLEYGRILSTDTSSGLRYELETIETGSEAYPLTCSFLRLLLAITDSLSPRVVLASNAFPTFLQFVIRDVFLRCEQRVCLPTRPAEKWLMISLCLQFLSSFLPLFQELSIDVLSESDRNLQQRLASVIGELLCGNEVLHQILSIPSITPSHSLLKQQISSDGIADSSVLVDFALFDAYSFQVRAIYDAIALVRQLLEVTPEVISRLSLRSQLPGTVSLVTSLASQLLADSHIAMTLLIHITDSLEPNLQLITLQVLRCLSDQLNSDLLVSLFDGYPEETMAIRAACNELCRSVLFLQQQDLSTDGKNKEESSEQELRRQACSVLLDLLVAHASVEFPSVVSVLLALPQSLVSIRAPGSVCLLGTLVTFLDSPALVSLHSVLGSKITRLFFLLCSHHDVGFISFSHF